MFRIFPWGTLFGNLVSRQLNSPRKLKFDFERRLSINRNTIEISLWQRYMSFFFCYVSHKNDIDGIFVNVLKKDYKLDNLKLEVNKNIYIYLFKWSFFYFLINRWSDILIWKLLNHCLTNNRSTLLLWSNYWPCSTCVANSWLTLL